MLGVEFIAMYKIFLTLSTVESILGGFASTLYIPSGDNYLHVHFSMILV